MDSKTSRNPNGIITSVPTTGSNTLRTKYTSCTLTSVQLYIGIITSVPTLIGSTIMHNNNSASQFGIITSLPIPRFYYI